MHVHRSILVCGCGCGCVLILHLSRKGQKKYKKYIFVTTFCICHEACFGVLLSSREWGRHPSSLKSNFFNQKIIKIVLLYAFMLWSLILSLAPNSQKRFFYTVFHYGFCSIRIYHSVILKHYATTILPLFRNTSHTLFIKLYMFN